MIQVYYNKNIELFSKNLLNIALKIAKCIKMAKKNYLLLAVAVSGTKDLFPLITFSNSHLKIDTSEI